MPSIAHPLSIPAVKAFTWFILEINNQIVTLVGISNVASPPDNTTVHQTNHVNENRTTSTNSGAVRNKSKNVGLFTNSIPKTLQTG